MKFRKNKTVKVPWEDGARLHIKSVRIAEILVNNPDLFADAKDIKAGQHGKDDKSPIRNVKFALVILKEAITGWDGIEYEDKTPMPYNDETKAAIIDSIIMDEKIQVKIFTACRGIMGNSKAGLTA